MFFGFYDDVGGSPAGVVRTLFTDPGAFSARSSRGTTSPTCVWLGSPAPVPLRALARARRGRAPAAARERALGLPLDDGPALPQRGRRHPVPDRGDGVRDRADRRAAARPLAAAAVLVCSATLAIFVGTVAARRRRGSARWARVRLADARRSARGRGRARPGRRARDGVELRRRHTSRPGGTSTRCRCSGSAEWVVVDLTDPWVVRPDSPILTRHPKVVRALVRSPRGRPERGRRSSRATAWSCFGSRRPELGSVLGRAMIVSSSLR